MTILQKYPTKTETFVRSVTKDCLENKCLVRDLRHRHTLSKTTKTIRASTKMKSRLKDKGLRLKVSKRWLLKVRHRPQINQDKVASPSKGIREYFYYIDHQGMVSDTFQSYYLYKAGDFNYRVRHPLVVARYHRNRWIKTDKWNLGRQRRV